MNDTFDNRFLDGYCLTSDAARLSVDAIHRWLSTEAYWAEGRSRDAVAVSIENTYLYGVVTPEGATIACTRVITDHVTFGWICDVFVEADYRGQGVGSWMVGEVVDYWTNVGVRRAKPTTSTPPWASSPWRCPIVSWRLTGGRSSQEHPRSRPRSISPSGDDR